MSKDTTALPGPRTEAGVCTVDKEGLDEEEEAKGVEKSGGATPDEEGVEEGGVEVGVGEEEETRRH